MKLEQRKLRTTIYRSGTSKGIYLHASDLPKDQTLRDQVILKLYGSPDVRQIDGLGGADPLTSKLAIIEPASREDADVDYTFAQVSFTSAKVDYSGNCGNISAAVGPFAIDEGLVRVVEPVTTVRIHNTNTQKIIIAEVPIHEGKASICGNYQIAGVPGMGAKIALDFADTAGAVTGKLLPTGQAIDQVEINGFGQLEVSIVDAANPVVFVRAADLNLTGVETPAEVDSNPELCVLLEKIRGKAAEMIGMVKDREKAEKESPAFPMIAFVSAPKDYVDFTTGKVISEKQVDLVSRLMYMQVMHKTYAGTGTICTGTAAKIPGTIVNQVLRPEAQKKDLINIGHPAGVIDIEVCLEVEPELSLKRAAIGRTARRLLRGDAYIPTSVWSAK